LLPQIQEDIPARAVGHYNDVVEQLRLNLQDNNLVHFRIPSSALHMTITRNQEDSFPMKNNRQRGTPMTEKEVERGKRVLELRN
jgi:hypothetical protein